jgi:hypothetical protein
LPLAASLLVCICSAAQTPDTATLTGIVQDPTHAAVAGAAISVSNELNGLRRTTRTSARGEFSLTGLPIAGAYNVEAVKAGFAPASLTHVLLAGGSAANVVVTLSISSANTSVTIEGTASDVRIDEPQLGDRLSSTEIEETPLLNRRITSLPLLNAANRPAINQGDIFMNQDLFTTNGAGRRQTVFEVDGAGANDSWGRQTLFTNIPEDAVAEMTVLTNGFSAEYGGGTGSVVNIVTKSGGDKLHGDVLELYRPSAPEAELSGFNASNATSGNEITNDALAQTAASLSGRLFKRDPTHFFFAGEFSQQNRASPVTSPLAPGNFIGHYRDLLGFLRLDRQQRLLSLQRRWVLRHQSQRHRRRSGAGQRRSHLPPPHLHAGVRRHRRPHSERREQPAHAVPAWIAHHAVLSSLRQHAVQRADRGIGDLYLRDQPVGVAAEPSVRVQRHGGHSHRQAPAHLRRRCGLCAHRRQ